MFVPFGMHEVVVDGHIREAGTAWSNSCGQTTAELQDPLSGKKKELKKKKKNILAKKKIITYVCSHAVDKKLNAIDFVVLHFSHNAIKTCLSLYTLLLFLLPFTVSDHPKKLIFWGTFCQNRVVVDLCFYSNSKIKVSETLIY